MCDTCGCNVTPGNAHLVKPGGTFSKTADGHERSITKAGLRSALLVEGVPDNLFILLSGCLTWPAVAMLLESDTPGFDALVAPGHVSTIMGPENLLAAMCSTLRQPVVQPKQLQATA